MNTSVTNVPNSNKCIRINSFTVEECTNIRTVDEIIADLAVFTDDQRSLAHCPEPPKESFPGDCRVGGNLGLGFSHSTLWARWVQAAFRMKREMRGAR